MSDIRDVCDIDSDPAGRLFLQQRRIMNVDLLPLAVRPDQHSGTSVVDGGRYAFRTRGGTYYITGYDRGVVEKLHSELFIMPVESGAAFEYGFVPGELFLEWTG